MPQTLYLCIVHYMIYRSEKGTQIYPARHNSIVTGVEIFSSAFCATILDYDLSQYLQGVTPTIASLLSRIPT